MELPVTHAVRAAPGRRSPTRGVPTVGAADGIPVAGAAHRAGRIVGIPERLDGVVLLVLLARRGGDHGVEQALVGLADGGAVLAQPVQEPADLRIGRLGCADHVHAPFQSPRLSGSVGRITLSGPARPVAQLQSPKSLYQ